MKPRARGQVVVAACKGCGSDRMRSLYPATATGGMPGDEFRCTTSALGVHDEILECPACGLLSSRPTISPGEIIEGYEEVVDEEYLSSEAERRELFEWVLGRMRRYTTAGDRLFEVGSNVGLFLAVASEAGWKAQGIEPSGWAVETGVERFGVDLVQGTVEDLKLPDRSVDALVMLDVLEHLSDPAAALDRLRPFVHEDGMMALATVNFDGLHGRLRGGDWPWFIRSHLHYFRPPVLVDMLRRSGFEVVEWNVVPRSFRVSYLLGRAGGTIPGARAAEKLARYADPKIPVGWIGDVTLLIARPAPG